MEVVLAESSAVVSGVELEAALAADWVMVWIMGLELATAEEWWVTVRAEVLAVGWALVWATVSKWDDS